MTTLTITGKSGNPLKFTKDDKGVCHLYSGRKGKTWSKHTVIDSTIFNRAQQHIKEVGAN